MNPDPSQITFYKYSANSVTTRPFNSIVGSEDGGYVIYEYGSTCIREIFTEPMDRNASGNWSIAPIKSRNQIRDIGVVGMDMSSQSHRIMAHIPKERMVIWGTPSVFFIYVLGYPVPPAGRLARTWKYVRDVRVGSLNVCIPKMISVDPSFEFLYTVKTTKNLREIYNMENHKLQMGIVSIQIGHSGTAFFRIHDVMGKIYHIEHSHRSRLLAVHWSSKEFAQHKGENMLEILNVDTYKSIDKHPYVIVDPLRQSIRTRRSFDSSDFDFLFLPDDTVMVLHVPGERHAVDIFDTTNLTFLKSIETPSASFILDFFDTYYSPVHRFRYVRSFKVGESVWIAMKDFNNLMVMYKLFNNHLVLMSEEVIRGPANLCADGKDMIYTKYYCNSLIELEGIRIMKEKTVMGLSEICDYIQICMCKSRKQVIHSLKMSVIKCIMQTCLKVTPPTPNSGE